MQILKDIKKVDQMVNFFVLKHMFDCVKIRKRVMEISVNMMKQKVKADILIIGCVLLVALLFFIVPCLNRAEVPEEVVIIQDGIEINRQLLSEDRTITVTCEERGYNLILISDGQVRVTDADCPDKLCIHQRQISRNGESIICLPHKLVIQIVSGKESGLDAIVN